jgi:hypothetical protein
VIVSVETFTKAQLKQRSRRACGRSGWSTIERDRRASKRVYLLRSMVGCGTCGRKMEGASRRRATTYYRCNARTLVPGSAVADAHPAQIYLREDLVTPAVNRWIGRLFDPAHRDATLDALHQADDTAEHHRTQMRNLQDRVAAAQATMSRLRRALEAGWDPTELREQYNAAVAEKRAAESALTTAPRETSLSRQELAVVVDSLGDMTRALERAEPRQLAELYASLRLSMTYHHAERTVDVEVDPLADRVDKLRVRGGT